jgi:Skp family chaperone for outer membrane proteins
LLPGLTADFFPETGHLLIRTTMLCFESFDCLYSTRNLQKQQSLSAEQERLGQGLLADQQSLQGVIQTKLKGILEEIRKENGYKYILNYATGTGVLMVDQSLDITKAVVEQLNNKEK